MTKHYAQNFEEELLIRQFRRIRRRQVNIAWVITFIVWYFFTGGNLLDCRSRALVRIYLENALVLKAYVFDYSK